MTLAVPLQVEETKIQPSLERVNLKDVLDLEIEATSSSTETRLFSFFSPEKRIPASASPDNPPMKMTTTANSLAFITKGHCAPAWLQLPAIFQPRMDTDKQGFNSPCTLTSAFGLPPGMLPASSTSMSEARLETALKTESTLPEESYCVTPFWN